MSKPRPIDGKFRITQMDQWDQDFVDAEVPGFILFDRHGRGEFQFGYVTGQMDCEQTDRGGKPAVEWTFDGNDEMDPIMGRGWVVLEEDGSLKGMLTIHNGERSGFIAVKEPSPKKPRPAKSGKQGKSRWKIRAINAETGKPMEIDGHLIKPGTIRNETLPDSLLRRIRAVHRAIKGVYNLPLEQMEINFMRDANPEREIVVWEHIVTALGRVSRAMPDVERKVILRTLLAYSLDNLSPADHANPTVKKIIEVVGRK